MTIREVGALGTVRYLLRGAELAATKGMDFSNTAIHRLSESVENSFEFSTITRGDESSLILSLTNVTTDAEIELNLGGAREFGGGPPKFRTHQDVPDTTVTLSLKKMADGVLIDSISNVDYIDRIKLRHIVTRGEKDVSFEVIDEGIVHGDYYYVRVKQANDAIAWSSPIWVGGFQRNRYSRWMHLKFTLSYSMTANYLVI